MQSAHNIKRTQYHVYFGSECINFWLILNCRNTLKIIVYPDTTVVVNAPEGSNIDYIMDRVKRRAPWIIRQKMYFEQFLPRPTGKKYINGETFLYLGRQYRLKVVFAKHHETKLSGKYLCVYTPKYANNIHVNNMVERWYSIHAQQVFEHRIKECYQTAKRYRIPKPILKIRKMIRRWGSCHGNNRILINRDLVKAPIHCIDYVIMHELCHLRRPNHDNSFYQLLAALLPDWETRKARLATAAT